MFRSKSKATDRLSTTYVFGAGGPSSAIRSLHNSMSNTDKLPPSPPVDPDVTGPNSMNLRAMGLNLSKITAHPSRATQRLLHQSLALSSAAASSSTPSAPTAPTPDRCAWPSAWPYMAELTRRPQFCGRDMTDEDMRKLGAIAMGGYKTCTLVDENGLDEHGKRPSDRHDAELEAALKLLDEQQKKNDAFARNIAAQRAKLLEAIAFRQAAKKKRTDGPEEGTGSRIPTTPTEGHPTIAHPGWKNQKRVINPPF